MSDDQADDFMREWDWAKWSDCRSMVQAAHHKGYMAGVEDTRQAASAGKAELLAALEGLMELERRDRFMPIGREWDAARAAIAKHGGTR